MIKKLLAYQEVDSKLRDIEVKISSSEDRKKALVAKKFLDSVEETIVKINAKAKELNEQYLKVLDDQKKLNEKEEEYAHAVKDVETEEEVAYLLKKIDETISKIKTLSATAQKINEEMQKVLAEYASLRKKTKAYQEQYKESANKYNEYKSTFDAEKEKIKAELAVLEKDVDAKLLERYKAKRAMKIFPIVFAVSGEFCGACNMQLDLSTLSKLKAGNIIDCEQCGRLIYLETSK